jgi:hypothetical protein
MTIDFGRALERALAEGDEWICRRALRLSGEEIEEWIEPPGQDPTGGFRAASGRLSPGATGAGLCHLVVVRAGASPAAVIAADWLEEARTPAGAWLDAPDDVPGGLDDYGGGRVWATAAAACALLSVGRDPGARALQLLTGEADQEGHFTGGAYPTFAAAAAYWLAEGPANETAEWAFRWAREWSEEWWGPAEWITALTFWAAARVPGEHESVERFVDDLVESAPALGWPDLDLTLRALELIRHFQG